MADYDLLIRGGDQHPFVGITEGRVAGLEEGSAREVIDATGLLVLPGVIDAHVHFNEPGRTEWEGLRTGSRACAAGGTTTFFDMPLNSAPPVIDAAAFAAKRARAEQESCVDFALWGGLVPGNVERLEELRDAGAIAIKAFMSNSGIEDFPKADPATLRAGLRRARELGLLVAVHAEQDHPEYVHGTTVRDYLRSRPVSMELEAIRLILELAGEAGCPLHIVHVSSAAGVRLIAEARERGMDVTCETCPHYLVLNEEDVERLGAVAKCAPPIREEKERLLLLETVAAGLVQMIASDHSPAPASLKEEADFFKVWGGISGCQHLLRLLPGLGLEAETISALTSLQPAERFGLRPRKGALTPGADADLVLLRPQETALTAAELQYRHAHSPYVGRSTTHTVARTILRGRPIFAEGHLLGEPAGQFLQPNR